MNETLIVEQKGKVLRCAKNISTVIDLVDKLSEAYPEDEEMQMNNRRTLAMLLVPHLRNLVENFIVLIYFSREEESIRISRKDELYKRAERRIKNDGRYRDIKAKCTELIKFRNKLNSRISHEALTPEMYEVFLVENFYSLKRVKAYAEEMFELKLIENINSIKIDIDKDDTLYKRAIAQQIEAGNDFIEPERDRRYYITRKKMLICDDKVYYEYSLVPVNDSDNKFRKILAFSRYDIMDNYSLRIAFESREVEVEGCRTAVCIIRGWRASIRPCALSKLGRLLGFSAGDVAVRSDNAEYVGLMNYLTTTGENILDILEADDETYDSILQYIGNARTSGVICNILDEARKWITTDRFGSNLVRYMTYKLNNRVINEVLGAEENARIREGLDEDNSDGEGGELRGLYCRNGALLFEYLPYSCNLPRHRTSIFDLMECIDPSGHQSEQLAREVHSISDEENVIYVKREKLEKFENIDELVDSFNEMAGDDELNLEDRLGTTASNVYLKDNEDRILDIGNSIYEMSQEGIEGYDSMYQDWLDNYSHDNISQSKIEMLENMFTDSKVALIYGAAGTGKTTLINCIAQVFTGMSKIFLSVTHSAVSNMRSRITDDLENTQFMTVNKYTKPKKLANYPDADVLIIDECSYLDDESIWKILQAGKYSYLVFVGDICQIKSISVGIWFKLAKSCFSSISYELTEQFRTNSDELISLWAAVRTCNDNMYDELQRYSKEVGSDILSKNNDEVILCYSYDGFYGINNINKIMQDNNPNEKVTFGLWTYKVDDPILFDYSELYSTNPAGGEPILYNNLKGTILGIEENENDISFTLEVEKKLTPDDIIRINENLKKVIRYHLPMELTDEADREAHVEEEVQRLGEMIELVSCDDENCKSVVTIRVLKSTDDDFDYDDFVTCVPFHVAYAVSIHKAQGLEYDSVKVVITKDHEERIDHGVFYTAITRAKSRLAIYWPLDLRSRIIQGFVNRDAELDNQKNVLKSRRHPLWID